MDFDDCGIVAEDVEHPKAPAWIGAYLARIMSVNRQLASKLVLIR